MPQVEWSHAVPGPGGHGHASGMAGAADGSSDSSPPTKASLLKWWKAFTSKHGSSNTTSGTKPGARRATVSAHPYQPPKRGLDPSQDSTGRVFGVSLDTSLRYASVAISMIGSDGATNVYGYIPVIVAKCGMYLKETAINTEGIFRVSGSNKRINELQVLFDSPPRYGKDLNWEGYTVHDAASVLRRYLNMLPDPVIPANLYLDFIAVLKKQQDTATSIADFRKLISLLPPTSRYLLLYLLDFLAMFARASSKNLMTASNLAVVFQPGLVSTREDATSEGALLGYPGFHGGKPPSNIAAARQGAGEHGKGKEVLEFLIEQQPNFVMGLETPIQTIEPHQQASSSSAVGAVDLARRGSEKSAERRKLRKAADGSNAKVKRSRTLPTRRSEDHTPKESPSESPRLTSDAPLPATSRPSSSAKRESTPVDSSSAKQDAGLTAPDGPAGRTKSSSRSPTSRSKALSPESAGMARAESSKSGASPKPTASPKWITKTVSRD